jgi:hypothetical protein
LDGSLGAGTRHRKSGNSSVSDNWAVDAERSLRKAEEALSWVEKHLMLTNEANAALHLASKVFYSPLTTTVHDALDGVRLTLKSRET